VLTFVSCCSFLFLSTLLQACQAAKGVDVYGGLTPALQGLLPPGSEVRQEAAVQAMDMDADLSSVRAFQSCCEEEAAGRKFKPCQESQLNFLCPNLQTALAVKRDHTCSIAGGDVAPPVLPSVLISDSPFDD
jgi:hypothetical protein